MRILILDDEFHRLYKVVPREPTPKQRIAMRKAWMVGSAADMERREYCAAIDAAPEVQGVELNTADDWTSFLLKMTGGKK